MVDKEKVVEKVAIGLAAVVISRKMEEKTPDDAKSGIAYLARRAAEGAVVGYVATKALQKLKEDKEEA